MTRTTINTKVAIIRWMIENRQWILDNRPTHIHAAEVVSAAVGHKVSHSTIGQIARSGELGFEWPVPKNKDHSKLVKTIKYASLVHKVKALEDRLARLEAALGVECADESEC